MVTLTSVRTITGKHWIVSVDGKVLRSYRTHDDAFWHAFALGYRTPQAARDAAIAQTAHRC